MRRYLDTANRNQTGEMSPLSEPAVGYATKGSRKVIGNTRAEWVIAIGAIIGLAIVILT